MLFFHDLILFFFYITSFYFSNTIMYKQCVSLSLSSIVKQYRNILNNPFGGPHNSDADYRVFITYPVGLVQLGFILWGGRPHSLGLSKCHILMVVALDEEEPGIPVQIPLPGTGLYKT